MSKADSLLLEVRGLVKDYPGELAVEEPTNRRLAVAFEELILAI